MIVTFLEFFSVNDPPLTMPSIETNDYVYFFTFFPTLELRIKKLLDCKTLPIWQKFTKIHLLTLVYQISAKLLRLSPRWYATDREEWSVRGSRGGGRRQRVRGRRRRIERCTRGGREREEGSFNRPLLCAGDIFPAHYCI